MADYRIRLHPDDTRPDALWGIIPDEHALLVGRFIAAYALVEFKLECIIWRLIKADKHALRPLTSRLDAKPKREAIDALMKQGAISAGHKAAWKEAKPILIKLSEHRSWIAHGLWVPLPIGAISVVMTRKGRSPDVIAKLKPLLDSEIKNWIAQAAQAIEHLNTLLPAQSDEPSPSPDKRQRRSRGR
jgi:hypothetical protein